LIASQQLSVLFAVHVYNNIRCHERDYLVRDALVKVDQSPWRKLLESGHDGSLKTLISLDFASFEALHDSVFTKEEIANQIPWTGRKPLLTLKDKLGIILFYIGSTMTEAQIGLIFGVTQTHISTTLSYMVPLICERLEHCPDAEIRFPTIPEMERFALMTNLRDPHVHGVIGFLDGCAIPIKCSFEDNQKYHNAYHGFTTINNVFLFSPDGTILYAAFNYPGTMHDSAVANNLMTVVKRHIGEFKIVVDQGFRRSGDMFNIFVGPISRRRRDRLPPAIRAAVIEQSNRYVSMRQPAEWGMRALQATYTRLKSPLTEDHNRRQLLVHSILLMHNFRTNRMGINQIRTVFDAEYERVIQTGTYDRIKRFFLQE